MTRPNRVRPKSGERLGIGLGHMVGSSLGGLTRAAKPVPKPPVAPVPAQPVAPSGGGAPTAVVRWQAFGSFTLGATITGYSLVDGVGDVMDDPIGPWDTYLEYNGFGSIIVIADCWVQVGFIASVAGGTAGGAYLMEGSAGDWGGVDITAVADTHGNASMAAGGAVVFLPAADSPAIEIRVNSPTGGSGHASVGILNVAVWAP